VGDPLSSKMRTGGNFRVRGFLDVNRYLVVHPIGLRRGFFALRDFMDPPNLVNLLFSPEITISKATFASSTSCTIHFEWLESAPND
jgi:hypothetical protein